MNSELPSSTETGKLGVMHLKRVWYKIKTANAGDSSSEENQLDKTVLFMLGLGLQQALKSIYQSKSFDEFEDSVSLIAGVPDAAKVKRFNEMITGAPKDTAVIKKIFNDEELSFFNTNGYIILRNAISVSDCEHIIKALCAFAGIDEQDPNTWYNEGDERQAIMIQLFQHPALQKTRDDKRIRQAFEQLWNRTDIWPTFDRVGFNPPVTETQLYRGQGLHWDVSLQQPIPFALQGLVYLRDTAANQGAFTLVPGFQHRVADWLQTLPAGANPREQNLDALGSKPITANAGDMIIWQQALPHGASPNHTDRPRFVQYLSYNPADLLHHSIWI